MIEREANLPEQMSSDGGKLSSQGTGSVTFLILADSYSKSLVKPLALSLGASFSRVWII